MKADSPLADEEKLLDQIRKMDDRIAAAKVQMGDRDKTKDVALTTSKINYIVGGLGCVESKKLMSAGSPSHCCLG